MPSKPNAFFITGTDTGVGKTHVSVSLVKALVKHGMKVAVMKPIASGSDRTSEGLRNEDAMALNAASNVDVPYTTLNPYCFEPAVSPHIAAEEAGIDVKIDVIKDNFTTLAGQADITVVEGAGGWYAPISPSQSMADLPKALNIPAILVVGVRLGCLNHAQLSKEAIQSRGVEFAGWVANMVDPKLERAAENLATLERILGRKPLAVFPFAVPEEKTTGGPPLRPSPQPQPPPSEWAQTPAVSSRHQPPTPAVAQALAATPASQSPTPAVAQALAPTPASQSPTPAPTPTPPVTSLAHPDVRCGEHFARSLSLIS